jgi:signal transduction histidine kinase
MTRETWVGWTTESLLRRPLLRHVHQLLGLVGLALLAKLLWVLVSPAVDGPAPAVFARAEHCIDRPVAAAHRRAGISHVLRRQSMATPACWKAVDLPMSFEAEASTGVHNEQFLGLAWIRVRYTVPADWPDSEMLLIYVPRVMGSAWQARVNGVTLADNLEDWRMTWNRPVSLRIEPTQLRPGQVLNIEIGIAYAPQSGHSISRITVGPASVVGGRLAWREYLQFTMPLACGTVLLLLGAFFFAFWCARRDETAHLLLALASVAWCVCNLQYVLPRQDTPALEGWYDGIVNVSVTWFMWLVYLFALRFDARRVRWMDWMLPVYVLTMSLMALPVWGAAIDANASVMFQAVNSVVAAGVTLLLGGLALRGGSLELRVLSLALLVALAAGTHDVALLAQAVHPESVYLLPYGGLLVFGAFLFAVQRRYVHAITEHEKLSGSLAQRLAEREAELTLNHQRLRELERTQTLTAERQRLMRDMHDGLGSALTSSLAVVERGEVQPEALASMLRECVDDLRDVIDSLEPMNNDLVALLATLRFRIGRRLEAAGLKLDWCMQDLPALEWLGPPEALQVMRLVQEVLANVVKHANAHSVSMAATQLGGEIEVCIIDDGVGFDASSSSAGRGLNFLAQRSAALGGTVVVESCCGSGTTVRLRLPVCK